MKCFCFNLNNLIKVSMLNSDIYTPPKKHGTRRISQYIMYIVTSGGVELISDGEYIKLSEGDIYIFDKNTYQSAVKASSFEIFYIHFDADDIKTLELTDAQYADYVQKNTNSFMKTDIYDTDCYNYMNVVLKQKNHISKSHLNYIVNILKNNTVCYGDNSPLWRMNISNTVAGVFIKIEAFAAADMQKQNKKSGYLYTNVKTIADYIEANYLKPIEGGDIERDLHINFDYANRIFKKYMGCSIIKYRNKLRINTAKSLMVVSNKSFKEIAEESGFCDQYYFSRYFKKTEGISPLEYKQSILNNSILEAKYDKL